MKLLIGYFGIVGTVLFLIIWGVSSVMTQAALNSERSDAARMTNAARARAGANSAEGKRPNAVKFATAQHEQEKALPADDKRQQLAGIANAVSAPAVENTGRSPEVATLPAAATRQTSVQPATPGSIVRQGPKSRYAFASTGAPERRKNEIALAHARRQSLAARHYKSHKYREAREWRDARDRDERNSDVSDILGFRRAYHKPQDYLDAGESYGPAPGHVVQRSGIPFLGIFD